MNRFALRLLYSLALIVLLPLAAHAGIANAGPDQERLEVSVVSLDGTGSTSENGGNLQYEWTQIAGTAVTLSGAQTPSPSFTAPNFDQGNPTQNTLRFRLTLTEDSPEQPPVSTDDVDITIRASQPPTANAGADQTVISGAAVVLDGSASSDPDGETLQYQWAQTGGPAVSFTGQGTSSIGFSAPNVAAPTDMTFRLTIQDAAGNTANDDVVVTVSPPNQPPTANAGPDQSVISGAAVAVDGSASSDPENGALQYQWVQTGGPSVPFTGQGTAVINFSAPSVQAATALTFKLTVQDPADDSGSDNVVINVSPPNQPPTANAGADQNVISGAAVTVDGSASSDPENGALQYQWAQTGGPSVAFTGQGTASINFSAPSVQAQTGLTFRLTVQDSAGDSSSDDAVVTVSPPNQPPTANAGADQSVISGAAVAVDGSASSDPENGALQYQWVQTGGPSVPFTGQGTAVINFSAPSVQAATALTFKLTVQDPADDSGSDNVVINVSPPNQPPTANAGADQNVISGAAVTVDGSASSDPENGALQYQWAQTGGPSVAFTGQGTASINFSAPSVQAQTGLTFRLTVQDSAGDSSSDDAVVTVSPPNQPPTANAGADQSVISGAAVAVDGSASSDPENGALQYQWAQTGGPSVTFTGQGTAKINFSAPGVQAQTGLTFRLTVQDPAGDSASDDAVVTVSPPNQPPIANAGADQSVISGAAVTVDGSASSDPENGALQYQWTQTGGPAVTLTGQGTAKIDFSAPSVQTPARLTFHLTVQDPAGGTASDDAVVTVSPPNQPPIANAGADQNVTSGAAVTVDGSASSDPEGGPLQHQWTQTGGPSVTFTGQGTAAINFSAPSVSLPSELAFRLTVRDPAGNSAVDDAIVTVSPPNQPPTADAGVDQTITSAGAVTIDGSRSSDPEGGPLQFDWQQIAGPVVSFTGQGSSAISFSAPAVTVVTPVTFQLTVHDAANNAATDDVVVTVVPVDQPPTANAGADQAAVSGAKVTLNGSASSDPEGATLQFVWQQIDGPAATLSPQGSATPAFTAPVVSAVTSLTFRLTVRDSANNTASDDVLVTVSPGDQPPVANAGADQAVAAGAAVTLDGSASSDPEGGALQFGWQQVDGPPVGLTLLGSAASFFAPATTAVTPITFRLTVRDVANHSSSDDVIVTVSPSNLPPNQPPAAHAGDDQTVEPGAIVRLDGSASADPDGEGFQSHWEQIAGVLIPLTDADKPVMTFTAPSIGEATILRFRLTVINASGTSNDDVTVSVSVKAASPDVPAPPVPRPPASIDSFSAFPNPFNPTRGPATFEYDLGADSGVRILIYDLFGSLVRELDADDSFGGARGRNRATWDGRNGKGDFVGNGGYVVQIQATADGHSVRDTVRLAVIK